MSDRDERGTSERPSSPDSAVSAPLIGLSSYREQARWGVWEQSADLLPTVYAQSIEAAGGVPVLLPPVAPSSAASVVARLDGMVISGGADVSPSLYGEQPHPLTIGWRDDRDAWELALLTAAAPLSLPVLGVCRGMQVMAVHAGGVLDQHVPDVVGHADHSPGSDSFGATSVRIDPASRLASLVGPSLAVHCHHHQSVRTHPGFTASAWSEDGLLEAMEAPGERMRVAVQWHPEMVADAGLFRALVEAASTR